MKNPVMSLGVINITNGKTLYDWSIYENPGLTAFLTNNGFLIFGTKRSFNIGDTYDLINDQSRRSLSKRGIILDSKSCEDKEEFTIWLKSYNYDYTPIKAFKKRAKNNKKLSTSYVLK